MRRNQIISLRLLELRQGRGLTQKRLCEELGISRANYSYFETGKRLPDIGTLLLLADFYNVSLDELVVGSAVPAGMGAADMAGMGDAAALARHLQSKHIPIDSVMHLSKADFDFLADYRRLSQENKDEMGYLMSYKLRKQGQPTG